MNRYQMLEAIANNATDAADLDDLIQFFYSAQYEYYDGFTDEKLVEHCNEEFGTNETLDK